MEKQASFGDAFSEDDEPSATEQAREAIEQARAELDAALLAVQEDHNPSVALPAVNECSEYIGKALWLLHLSQNEGPSS